MSQTPKQLIRILGFGEKGSEALPGSYFLTFAFGFWHLAYGSVIVKF